MSTTPIPATSATLATIRRYQAQDWPQLWPILHATIEAGDTFAFAPHSSQTEVFKAWIDTPGAATFVATTADGTLLGAYKIQANQPGLGSHVGNGSYVVAAQARGHGIASAMCQHSQAEAVAMGFKAMQFNLVVSTNEVAVRLWQKHGFAIVGTLPGAFLHQVHGYVDAYVMFKTLAP
jgi:ribosomal protein S18 acetylase RimI-like enzyme